MERITGGATLWARQTIESDIFIFKPDKWFKIWFYIVNKVNYKKTNQFNRGETFIKYQWISDATGATKNQIDMFIRWAKECQMLTTRKTTRGMIVNVLKYEVYQDINSYKNDTENETLTKHKRNTNDTILNKGNKRNKGNNIYIQKKEFLNKFKLKEEYKKNHNGSLKGFIIN